MQRRRGSFGEKFEMRWRSFSLAEAALTSIRARTHAHTHTYTLLLLPHILGNFLRLPPIYTPFPNFLPPPFPPPKKTKTNGPLLAAVRRWEEDGERAARYLPLSPTTFCECNFAVVGTLRRSIFKVEDASLLGRGKRTMWEFMFTPFRLREEIWFSADERKRWIRCIESNLHIFMGWKRLISRDDDGRAFFTSTPYTTIIASSETRTTGFVLRGLWAPNWSGNRRWIAGSDAITQRVVEGQALIPLIDSINDFDSLSSLCWKFPKIPLKPAFHLFVL